MIIYIAAVPEFEVDWRTMMGLVEDMVMDVCEVHLQLVLVALKAPHFCYLDNIIFNLDKFKLGAVPEAADSRSSIEWPFYTATFYVIRIENRITIRSLFLKQTSERLFRITISTTSHSTAARPRMNPDESSVFYSSAIL